MSDIYYDFASNNDSLDGINNHVANINDLKDQVATLFGHLSQAYGGEGADALQHAHGQIHNMLDEATQDAHGTNINALDQQSMMQQLDNKNAAAF